MKTNKTGIYIRVSTEEQAKHGFSIRAQKEKLTNYAIIKEWEIYDFYVDDGISGKNLERPAIKSLIEDIKNNKINNILVFKVDRLTRSTKDLIYLIELFQQYNCDFNSLNESIDTSTPTGRMFIKIIGLFAEFERETIVERIKMGLERKVKEGYSLCSSTPSYGYSRNRGSKIQEINTTESKIVIQIYDMYLKNKTIKEIKDYLNKNEIRTKKSKNWSNKTIVNILKNPNYIGNVRYGINTNKYFEKKGKHEGIISKQVFDKVQIKLNHSLRTKEDAYYSNKLICICGKKLCTKRTYIKQKCYINYICKNNSCSIGSISHNYLDKYLKIKSINKNKKDYVQTAIEKIILLSLEKHLLVIYSHLKNFTLK